MQSVEEVVRQSVQASPVVLTGDEAIVLDAEMIRSFISHNVYEYESVDFSQELIGYLNVNRDKIIILEQDYNEVDNGFNYEDITSEHLFAFQRFKKCKRNILVSSNKNILEKFKNTTDDRFLKYIMSWLSKDANQTYGDDDYEQNTNEDKIMRIISITNERPTVFLTADKNFIEFKDKLSRLATKNKLFITQPKHIKFKHIELDDELIIFDRNTMIPLIENIIYGSPSNEFSDELLTYLNNDKVMKKTFIPPNIREIFYNAFKYNGIIDKVEALKKLENYQILDHNKLDYEKEFGCVKEIVNDKENDPYTKTTKKWLYKEFTKHAIDKEWNIIDGESIHMNINNKFTENPDIYKHLKIRHEKGRNDIQFVSAALMKANKSPVIFVTNDEDFLALREKLAKIETKYKFIITSPRNLTVSNKHITKNTFKPLINIKLTNDSIFTFDTQTLIAFINDTIDMSKVFPHDLKNFILNNMDRIIVPDIIYRKAENIIKNSGNSKEKIDKLYKIKNIISSSEHKELSNKINKLYQDAANDPYSLLTECWIHTKADDILEGKNIITNANIRPPDRIKAINYLLNDNEMIENITQIIKLTDKNPTIFFTRDGNYITFRKELEKLTVNNKLTIVNPINS